MSITELTILQFTKTLLAYFLITVFLPALLFHKKVTTEKISIHFLIYFTIGNFFMMNIVFALQLLHICNRFTLIVFTILPGILSYGRLNNISYLKLFQDMLRKLNKMILGQLKASKLMLGFRIKLQHHIKIQLQHLFKAIRKNILDILLLSLFSVAMIWKLGANLVGNIGYGASDLPVHNYWINGLSQGKLYVAGIYPEGFHATLYYLHTVFRIDTYVLLRIFWMIQYMFVVYVLFAFMKAICKGRYLPYVGIAIYLLYNFFNVSTTMARLYSSLPQEFGQIFILLPIYFISAFFEKRGIELKEETMSKWSKSNLYLVLFALSFSLTISAHFYDTMISGILCLGIAVGYGFRFFQRRYYSYVIVSGALGVVIAVLPMAIAFIMGTPLQGSLIWGLKIILGEDYDGTINMLMIIVILIAVAIVTVILVFIWKVRNHKSKGILAVLFELVSVFGVAGFIYLTKDILKLEIVNYVLSTKYNPYSVWVIYLILANLGMGLLIFLLRDKDYGARIISIAVGLVLLIIILNSSKFGIPMLMQPSRVCIYIAYTLPCTVIFLVDGALFLIFGVRASFVIRFLSFAATVAVSVDCYQNQDQIIRLVMNGLETRGAIICLSNIRKQEEDMTWTIVSCNDEYRMVEDNGRHYETITFLEKMEGLSNTSLITIPTKLVYFFIEKQPIDYAGTYGKEIPAVSLEGAKEDLPQNDGLNAYTRLNRWITMSKMYYWAQSFEKLFPNEMKVFYEDDQFICYRIEQNNFRLYNFAIDYGYNGKIKRRVAE